MLVVLPTPVCMSFMEVGTKLGQTIAKDWVAISLQDLFVRSRPEIFKRPAYITILSGYGVSL